MLLAPLWLILVLLAGLTIAGRPSRLDETMSHVAGCSVTNTINSLFSTARITCLRDRLIILINPDTK